MKIGDKVRDSASGLRGEIIGEATYANGAHQFLVQPALDREGRFQPATWVDAYRLTPDTGPDISFFGSTDRFTAGVKDS